MNRIFFIIPVYNVEKYLERCINSVLNQTALNIEIILVNDGSKDNSPRICDEFAQKYDNINVIHKENGGLSDARNAGLLFVGKKGEPDDYITFLDSDDFLHETYAEKMIKLCTEMECDMAQCQYEKGSEDTFSENSFEVVSFAKTSEESLLNYDLKSLSCAKIYKLRVFKDLFFPVGVWNEDEFVTYRAVYSSCKVAFTNEKLYYYFQHEQSIMDNVAKRIKDNPHRYDYLKAYKERAEFFQKEKKDDLVLKTYEKVCTDIILRYCEQMYLKKSERDIDCVSGKYLKIYREHYKKMIKRKGIPVKRKAMFVSFNMFPYSAVVMGKFFTLRK